MNDKIKLEVDLPLGWTFLRRELFCFHEKFAAVNQSKQRQAAKATWSKQKNQSDKKTFSGADEQKKSSFLCGLALT